jgi:hypothetical protein
MGVAIKCILEEDVPGVPHMEGKSLAMAYCGDPGERVAGDLDTSADIIAIDFGGTKPKTPSPSKPSPTESLFAPLDPFLAGDGGVRWHDATKGLTTVRSILKKLRDGAIVAVAPDFEFGGDDDEELTEGVRYDLEELEQILVGAQKARTRFCLIFDV